MRKDNILIGLIGIILFFLVLSVLYIILTSESVLGFKTESVLQGLMPFVVLTGFFIFLVGAMLVSQAIHRIIIKK